MAKPKSTKKKGPKGKKARAKAKLERQWGETAIVDDEKPRRIGNSRLKARVLANKAERIIRWADELAGECKSTPLQGLGNAPSVLKNKYSRESLTKEEKSESEDDVSFSDSDGNPDGDEEAPALQGLLNAIQKKRSTATRDKQAIDGLKGEQTGFDNDEEASESSDGEDMSDESEIKEQDDGTGNEDEDESSLEGDAEHQLDIYRHRFSQQPLEPSELRQTKAPLPSTITIDENVQLQVTSPFPSRVNSSYVVDSKTTDRSLKHLAEASFQRNRQVLKKRWKRSKSGTFKDSQWPIYPFMASYMDLLITAESRKQRNELHQIHLLHVLNHVMTSRSRIQRHNRQKKAFDDASPEANGEKDGAKMERDDDHFRDQGFTRPTVLVLMPTRDCCYKFVNNLIALTGVERAGPHVERFDVEFGKPGEAEAEDEEENLADPSKERRRKEVLEKKGKDWNDFFGDEVNQDDDFKIGIALTPKAARGKKETTPSSNIQVKLYTDFFKSDIIVASPLGLKVLIAPDDEEGTEGDADYLSSIEICLVEYADILMMQNWDHANHIFALLNQEPKKNNETDFSRVRLPALEGQGEHWRQLIISSGIVDPVLISSFKRHAKSISGSVRVHRKVQPEEAALAKVVLPMKQVFQKVAVPSFDRQTTARVDYFVKNILPQIQRHKQKHTMIYIPSYFDFVALRNIFLKREISFVSVHEYSRVTETSRGRARFLQGRKPIMLFTGRSYFFQRHAIKGVHHLIFLGLPEHPQFYADQVNLIQTAITADYSDDMSAGSSSCLALFTRYEGHALERIVGTANCGRMLQNEKATFMFHS